VWVAAAFALTALLSYSAYLIVWASRSVWLRPLLAGVAAPLLALLLIPVHVAPAGGHGYYTRPAGSTRADRALAIESEARGQTWRGAFIVALGFGLASMALPRPGAARR
jgi:hypothetical protein